MNWGRFIRGSQETHLSLATTYGVKVPLNPIPTVERSLLVNTVTMEAKGIH